MRDMSATGARMADLPQDEIPKDFLLSLSRDGKVRRKCKVVWRKDDQIGVLFSTA